MKENVIYDYYVQEMVNDTWTRRYNKIAKTHLDTKGYLHLETSKQSHGYEAAYQSSILMFSAGKLSPIDIAGAQVVKARLQQQSDIKAQ